MTSRALMDAIKNSDLTGVRSVLAVDSTAVSSREDPASAVLTALYHGKGEIAEFLATHLDLDVFEAAAMGNTARLDGLLAGDPSVTRHSSDGWTPLHLAAFFGRTETARQLMDAGADLKEVSSNSTGNTPLHAALAGRGSEELVLRMLMAGADAAATGADGYTPLHVAASRGDQRVCELLIQYRAQPSAKMTDGRTAADVAAERGHDSLADYLRSLQ